MSDKIPVLKVSSTNLSMSAISQHCSALEPGYSWHTALTNLWYSAVTSANSGNISHSLAVLQSTNCRACPFISTSSTTSDHTNWNLRLLKKQWSPHSLVVMSLLIRYAHIPFYFRFSFTFPTSPIHPYTPPLRCDRMRSRSLSHNNHTCSIRPISLI